MTKEAAAQFDALAALYEDMAAWPFRRDIEIPSVLEALGDMRGLDVLDFGCGTGMYARMLSSSGARRVVGYDLADGMLDHARRRAEKDGFDIAFTAKLTPDLDGRFDVVLAVYVLPYAQTRDELVAMCADMLRLLRPGGRLVALPIHPLYDPLPSYYEPYGFRLDPEEGSVNPYRDGRRLRLDLCYEQHRASVYAWYWSKETLEACLREAGAASVAWRDPHAANYAAAGRSPPAGLRRYLDRPHAALIECRRG
jgi:ubiquinone/menaquinone biosynthesis C-methylase UbiE